MRQNKDTLLRGRDSWHLQEIPMAKAENSSHKGVFMEAGRSCLHRPSTGKKAPHFTNLSYQLLSSTGVTTYLSQQKVHLGKSIFSKSSPLPLAASALEKNLTNAISGVCCLTHTVQV